jgi:hypothetical protein
MNPQEFRQAYLNSQDTIGNNLQSLTNLLLEFNTLVAEVISNYETVNTMVETFINQADQTESEN